MNASQAQFMLYPLVIYHIITNFYIEKKFPTFDWKLLLRDYALANILSNANKASSAICFLTVI